MKVPTICITKHRGGDWYVMIKNKMSNNYTAYHIASASVVDDAFAFTLHAAKFYTGTLDLVKLLQKVVKDR